jgi:hypothetical protein
MRRDDEPILVFTVDCLRARCGRIWRGSQVWGATAGKGRGKCDAVVTSQARRVHSRASQSFSVHHRSITLA